MAGKGWRSIRTQALSDPGFERESQEGRIVAGLDGSVWQTWPDGLFRLGQDATHAWDRPKTPADGVIDIDVGPDGTLWLVSERRLLSFDGNEWLVRKRLPDGQNVLAVELGSNGEVWAAWQNGKGLWRNAVLRLDGEGWTVLGQVPGGLSRDSRWQRIETTRSGCCPRTRRSDATAAAGWEAVDAPAGGQLDMDVGPDGTVWVRLHEDCGPGSPGNVTDDEGKPSESCYGRSSTLARLRDGEWTRYEEWDGVPTMDRFIEVAPDGRLWAPSYGCEGIAAFHGEALRDYLVNRIYLADLCIYDADVSPAGNVWILAGPSEAELTGTGRIDTYVITPEAILPHPR